MMYGEKAVGDLFSVLTFVVSSFSQFWVGDGTGIGIAPHIRRMVLPWPGLIGSDYDFVEVVAPSDPLVVLDSFDLVGIF